MLYIESKLGEMRHKKKNIVIDNVDCVPHSLKYLSNFK